MAGNISFYIVRLDYHNRILVHYLNAEDGIFIADYFSPSSIFKTLDDAKNALEQFFKRTNPQDITIIVYRSLNNSWSVCSEVILKNNIKEETYYIIELETDCFNSPWYCYNNAILKDEYCCDMPNATRYSTPDNAFEALTNIPEKITQHYINGHVVRIDEENGVICNISVKHTRVLIK